MNDKLEFKLDTKTLENLEVYSKLLDKDINTILNEALSLYFQKEEEKLIAQNLEGDSGMTNLDFDEFWEDVEI